MQRRIITYILELLRFQGPNDGSLLAFLPGEFQLLFPMSEIPTSEKRHFSFLPSCKQSTTTVAAGSTTAMRMPSAPTLSRDTAAPASLATWATGPSAEVGWLLQGEAAYELPPLPGLLRAPVTGPLCVLSGDWPRLWFLSLVGSAGKGTVQQRWIKMLWVWLLLRRKKVCLWVEHGPVSWRLSPALPVGLCLWCGCAGGWGGVYSESPTQTARGPHSWPPLGGTGC